MDGVERFSEIKVMRVKNTKKEQKYKTITLKETISNFTQYSSKTVFRKLYLCLVQDYNPYVLLLSHFPQAKRRLSNPSDIIKQLNHTPSRRVSVAHDHIITDLPTRTRVHSNRSTSTDQSAIDSQPISVKFIARRVEEEIM